MFKTLRNAFASPDIRKKLLYVVFILIIYRIGCAIPVPFLDPQMESLVDEIAKANSGGSIFEYLSLISGSAFAQAKLFALSISPYINASIIMQLLCVAIPALERMSKEEDGRKKVTQITRMVTIAISLVTSYGYYMLLKSYGFIVNPNLFKAIVIIACYTAGSALIMWLGEKINDNGIGNGISLILFVNIVSGAPTYIASTVTSVASGSVTAIISAVLTLVIIIAMALLVIFISNSERRLQVQYAKRVVGRKMYGGQNSTLPLKLNMSGVMPVIFANSILAIPSTIGMIFPAKAGSFWEKFLGIFSYQSWLYAALFLVLIIAFSYFYIAISFNPVEVANNLKNQGGFIPGLRPGKPTADYITKVLNKITLMGAFFLALIAVLPLVINLVCMIFNMSLGSVAFAGISVIIVVGVAVETFREIEAQMTMRHYKGFLE